MFVEEFWGWVAQQKFENHFILLAHQCWRIRGPLFWRMWMDLRKTSTTTGKMWMKSSEEMNEKLFLMLTWVFGGFSHVKISHFLGSMFNFFIFSFLKTRKTARDEMNNKVQLSLLQDFPLKSSSIKISFTFHAIFSPFSYLKENESNSRFIWTFIKEEKKCRLSNFCVRNTLLNPSPARLHTQLPLRCE